jgi:hypothetical protein
MKKLPDHGNSNRILHPLALMHRDSNDLQNGCIQYPISNRAEKTGSKPMDLGIPDYVQQIIKAISIE